MSEILHPFSTKFRQILRGNIDQYFFEKECFRSSFYSDYPLTIRHFETGLFKRPTLNSIRQTDVDTLMIRTQSRVRVRARVRVRVRVIYLNQTGIGHQILDCVGVRVIHSRSDAPSSNPTHSILN